MQKRLMMAYRRLVKNSLTLFVVTAVSAAYLKTAQGSSVDSSHVTDQFLCLDGTGIQREGFCNGDYNCPDGSDERYCSEPYYESLSCPNAIPRWRHCADGQRCIPSIWACDGKQDCPDESDEKNCPSVLTLISGAEEVKRDLTQHLLRTRRQHTRPISKRGPHTTRTAVALFLNDQQFFAPDNKTKEEISCVLSLQLLSKLALKEKISTNELALFINALNVACIDPKDFYDVNMVHGLRKRVNNSNFTNPFNILTLCLAKDKMTSDDVLKLQQQYDANYRPLWTDTQAMVVMALSCIASRSDVDVDERILGEMVSDLKKKQHKNGTIDNLKTTALVVQALIAADENYRTDFDMDSAIEFILEEVGQTYPSIQDMYYILPIFSSMSLVNISSDHCQISNETVSDLEVISNLFPYQEERIQVRASIIVGDNQNFSRTWTFTVPSNYSSYQVLENIDTLEPAYKVRYGVSQGKPYVVSMAKFQDDSEEDFFWFIYTKPLSSTATPKLIEESPVDIQVKETEELILWYRSGFWANSQENPSV